MPLGQCLRVLAFNLGPIVVDHLVRYANASSRDRSEASDCPMADSRLDAALQRLIKIMSMPITDATTPKLLASMW